MQMIVGAIKHDDTVMVQLQPIDKSGKPVGEPLESEAFDTHGVLTVNEQGQVILQEKSKPKESGDQTS